MVRGCLKEKEFSLCTGATGRLCRYRRKTKRRIINRTRSGNNTRHIGAGTKARRRAVEWKSHRGTRHACVPLTTISYRGMILSSRRQHLRDTSLWLASRIFSQVRVSDSWNLLVISRPQIVVVLECHFFHKHSHAPKSLLGSTLQRRVSATLCIIFLYFTMLLATAAAASCKNHSIHQRKSIPPFRVDVFADKPLIRASKFHQKTEHLPRAGLHWPR